MCVCLTCEPERQNAAPPAAPETVVGFLAAEAAGDIKPSSIGRRVAAIRYAHKACRYRRARVQNGRCKRSGPSQLTPFPANEMAAARIMQETADRLEAMRGRLASALGDPELMLRRVKMDEGQDAELRAAGARLKQAILWSRGRAVRSTRA